MPRQLLLVASALAAGCASGAGGTATATPPTPYAPAAAPPAERSSARHPGADAVHFGPSALRYLIHRRLHIQQEFGGQTQTQDLGARIFVAATITGPADSAGYPTTYTIDSIVSDSGTPPQIADNVAKAKGLAFTGRLAATGEFKKIAPSDSTLALSLVQLLGNFREFMPRIPAGGVKVGAAWSDTLVATQKGGGSEITKRSLVNSTAGAWDERGGVRSLRLEVGSTYTLQGAGEGAGQSFELSGSGIASGVAFLAVDGRYLGGESHDSTNLSIKLPAQGLLVPVIQVTRLTVSVVP